MNTKFVQNLGESLTIIIIFFLVSVVSVRAATLLDTDQDGIPDEWEQQAFQTDPLDKDTDKDGHDDLREILSGFDPKGTGKLVEHDTDADELSDRLELFFGTNPLEKDSDQDGFSDGKEVHDAYSPTTTSPIRLQKEIQIILKPQRIEQKVMGIAIHSASISSGLQKTPTPVGTFRVLSKNRKAWSKQAGLWMPYWMHFSGRGHGIHELPEWPGGKKEGASHLGKPASHGCVRVGVGMAKSLYDWSPVGTIVRVTKS